MHGSAVTIPPANSLGLGSKMCSKLPWPTRDMLQTKEMLETKKESLQIKKNRCK